MSRRPAILLTVLLAILLPYYLLADRPQMRQLHVKQQERAGLLKIDAVQAVTLTRGNESLKFEKTADGKLFKVVAPPNGFAPQDLMNALVALFVDAKDVEIVSDTSDDLAQFGLDHPKAEVLIETPGGAPPIRLIFGSDNPTHTAVYAKIESSPKVFLLGRNLEYYQDLMFQWVEGKQGKNA